MATRKPTKVDEQPDYSLTEQQWTAVALLVSGHNLQDTADALGVQRCTVSKWSNHHPGFQAAVNQRRQEVWQSQLERLRALLPMALDVLERELQGATPLAAAKEILRVCGIASAAPNGATDPDAIALAMQMAADEQEHLAVEAALTRRRRQQQDFDDLMLPA
jgi:hypothetical protein